MFREKESFEKRGFQPARVRGLIVKEPYASMIVKGEKTWEIRKRRTNVRGRILIISGGHIIGEAEIVEVLGPFTVDELSKFEKFHRVSRDMLEKYSGGKELFAWVLANPKEYVEKIRVIVPRGAQIWVRL